MKNMEALEEFKKQCGEVYLLSSGTMTFHCTLCEEKHNGFDDFAGHIYLKHQVDECTIKEEIMEDMEDNPEVNGFSVAMDSCDSNDNSIAVQPSVLPDTEVKYFEESILSFEVAIVEENEEDGIIKQIETTKNLNVNKLEKPRKIVSRQQKNSDETSKQGRHVCTECDYSTHYKVKLVEHIRRHFNDRPFSCDFCEQRFYMKNEKTRHTARQHPETVEPKKPSPEKIELRARIKSSLISLGNNKFECKECDFTCENRDAMWHHIRRHSSYKPYQCTICPKTFRSSNELNTHIRTHTGEKPFLCTECGDKFPTSSRLSYHLKRHNNTRDRECPICQRRFFDTRQLRCHMACHSDERPFACEKCPSTFKRKKTLISHMRAHLNNQALQCEICDASFRQKSGLLIHIRAKHTLTRKELDTNSQSDIKIE